MPVKVTLHIHSGRPDPTWDLDEKQIEELEVLLIAYRQTGMAETSDSENSVDTLCYRGFSIESSGRPNVEPLIFIKGGPADPKNPWLFPAKVVLEGWLLSTAGDRLDKSATDYVITQIRPM